MKTNTYRKQRNKSQSVAHTASSGLKPETAFHFADNRPQAMAQRVMQAMAANSQRAKKAAHFQELTNPSASAPIQGKSNQASPIQRFIRIKDGDLTGEYTTAGGKDTNWLLKEVEGLLGDKLKRGWKIYVKRIAADDKKHRFYTTELFLKILLKRFKKLKTKKKRIRPNFPKASYDLGRVTLGIQTGKDQSDFSPSDNDAALPHRFPYAAIQESTRKYIDGEEKKADLIRWSDRLKKATEERLAINKKKLAKDKSAQQSYELKVSLQIGFFNTARKNLISAVEGGQKLKLSSGVVQDFLKWTNALHGNIPDYGPHSTVNIPVSDRLHLHFESGRLTPGSKAAGSMTPTRSRGIAMTEDGEHIVTTDGLAMEYESLDEEDQDLLDPQKKSNTKLDKDDLSGSDF